MKLAILGSQNSTLGFKAIGFDVFSDLTKINLDDYGILFIAEDWAEKFYKEINERELYSMLLDTLSLGDNNEDISVPTSISSDDKLKILLVMHGLLPDNFQTNELVKRGEVFNVILNIIER